MQRKNTRYLSNESNSNVVNLNDFILLTLLNGVQVIGILLTEDDQNIYLKDTYTVLMNGLMPFDQDSIGVDVFSKATLATRAWPKHSTIIRYISTYQTHMNNALGTNQEQEDKFPTTQFDYLIEGPVKVTH